MSKYRTVFITDRLFIKEVALEDVYNIHQLHSLPETDKFNTLGIPASALVTEEIVKNWIKDHAASPRVSYVLAIELKDAKKFIGLIAITLGKSNFKSAEVWYKMHVDHWNKGYTTEALRELLKFGYDDLKLHRIEAGCAVKNIASIKVLEKAGMTREGRKQKNLPIRVESGMIVSNMLYWRKNSICNNCFKLPFYKATRTKYLIKK